MKLLSFLFTVIIFSSLSVSCKKQKPQLPSNKTENSTEVFVMDKINKTLVEKEDSLLMTYVNSQEINFSKDPSGYYYFVTKHSSGDFLKNNDECVISYQIYLLNDELVEKEENMNITVGKHHTLKGIDLALLKLRREEEAIVILPWSLAYGILGNGDLVGPYTSVRLILSVKND